LIPDSYLGRPVKTLRKKKNLLSNLSKTTYHMMPVSLLRDPVNVFSKKKSDTSLEPSPIKSKTSSAFPNQFKCQSKEDFEDNTKNERGENLEPELDLVIKEQNNNL
jgi:hypothetical protein